MAVPARLAPLRGLLGFGAFTGAVWGLVGLAIGMAVLVFDPASIDAGEEPYWIAFYFSRAGITAGIFAGLLIAQAERRKAVTSLRAIRLSGWGALGGVAVSLFGLGPAPMWPIFALLGAGTGLMAWTAVRRGSPIAAPPPPLLP
ncbi:MAG: hypothetical protein AB7L66_02705 [Gemmatimonadales bacterium]